MNVVMTVRKRMKMAVSAKMTDIGDDDHDDCDKYDDCDMDDDGKD